MYFWCTNINLNIYHLPYIAFHPKIWLHLQDIQLHICFLRHWINHPEDIGIGYGPNLWVDHQDILSDIDPPQNLEPFLWQSNFCHIFHHCQHQKFPRRLNMPLQKSLFIIVTLLLISQLQFCENGIFDRLKVWAIFLLQNTLSIEKRTSYDDI